MLVVIAWPLDQHTSETVQGKDRFTGFKNRKYSVRNLRVPVHAINNLVE